MPKKKTGGKGPLSTNVNHSVKKRNPPIVRATKAKGAGGNHGGAFTTTPSKATHGGQRSHGQ